MDLFRKEALQNARQRDPGTVLLAQPLSFTVLTLFLAALVAILVGFAAFGSYARKATVPGFLAPDTGIARIRAPRAGIIDAVYVHDGQRVSEGTLLLSIVGEQTTGSGLLVDAEMLATVARQIDDTRTRLRGEERREALEYERLANERSGLGNEIATIDQQLSLQRRMLGLQRKNLADIAAIVDKGYVSRYEYGLQQEKLLDTEQALAALRQRRASLSTRIAQAEAALARLPFDFDERRSTLNQQLAALQLQRIELSGQRSQAVVASIDGKVTGVRAKTGMAVGAHAPLLDILPLGGMLEAQLYVPTRAIGFVQVGQEVRLMYDAFDYRRFGVRTGTVMTISSVVFAADEIRRDVAVSEPSYRVTVRLASQSIPAYGRRIPLQPGMQLTADIVLEHRALLRWLLDPLLGLRGRT